MDPAAVLLDCRDEPSPGDVSGQPRRGGENGIVGRRELEHLDGEELRRRRRTLRP
jgi:hypothetical protein